MEIKEKERMIGELQEMMRKTTAIWNKLWDMQYELIQSKIQEYKKRAEHREDGGEKC